jgi:small-conductance mechanosensitive channel
MLILGEPVAAMAGVSKESEPASALREMGTHLLDDPGLWLTELVEELTVAFKIFLPNLIGGLALLLIGWVAAYVVRWLIHRFGSGLDAILAVINRWLGQKVPRAHWSISKVVGDIAFWIILMYTVSAAANQVGLLTFSEWVLGLLGYLPRVLISAFTLFIGYLISSGVRNLIVATADSTGFRHGSALGHITSGLILAFTLLLALDQLGLDVVIFSQIIVLAAAALFGAAAVAFGIGASDAVRNVMASHYVRTAYQPGQKVRVQEFEGVILEMTQVAVVVATPDGEAWIPARRFLDDVALVIDAEQQEDA